MSEFTADLRDLKFALFSHLGLSSLLQTDAFRDFSEEDVEMILDEAYKIAREVLAPCNREGDLHGATLREDGEVELPPSFKAAYDQIRDGGWIGLNHSPEFGGQGAPEVLKMAVDDLFFAANITLNLGILLTPGAAHLIETFGDDALKQTYVEKMYTGQWSGTMCLTEPQAGSDVGAVRTRATRHEDHFLIEGEKIFITFGEHQLTENIVHCVLARIEGAPAGTRGISLFAVPKFLVNPDGSLGERNGVRCTALEHKMGINASPTCQMSFGASGPCHGWLIGEENRGMRQMFQMMNEARISVGQQGAALANASYQAALAYARERLQGGPPGVKDPTAPRVPIITHPDVRHMLMRQKAYAEACRAMLLQAAHAGDMSRAAGDEETRRRYRLLLDILTPICKAYCSDMGFRVTEIGVQVFGGYGYLKDYPVEQYLRDCKIASLYEGTNGIQALDLIGRKLTMEGGAALAALETRLGEALGKVKEEASLSAEAAALERAFGVARKATGALAAGMQKNPLLPMVSATTYLALVGDVLSAALLAEQAAVAAPLARERCEALGVDPGDRAAVRRACEEDAELRYLEGKLQTARFFCARELPQAEAKGAAIASDDASALEMVWEPAG